MRSLLPTMAVILGLTNAILYSLLGDDDSMGPFDWELQQWPQSVLYAFTGIVVGLLVSGALLRFARSGLRGSFFGRYGLIVLAVCLGGAAMGPPWSSLRSYSARMHPCRTAPPSLRP